MAVLKNRVILVLVTLLAILPAPPAIAHSMGESATGFGAGFLHPLTGLDHLLAMVSVGIWGAFLGCRRFGYCRSRFR